MTRTIMMIFPFVALAATAGWLTRQGESDRQNEEQHQSLHLQQQPTPATPANSFAVVELFTSEGCSSCPPADKLLGTIIDEARTTGSHIYPLAFHVDYWDHLGWKDPFSDPAWSARQRDYGRNLRLSNIYTPQMIVNGTTEFVGSERDQAATSIADALETPATCAITLHAGTEATSHRISVSYTMQGAPAEGTLNLAVVERDLAVSVPRGENSGRKLHHDNVVRLFRSFSLNGKSDGNVVLDIPPSVVPANAGVIAFVQIPTTMAIVGAAEAAIE